MRSSSDKDQHVHPRELAARPVAGRACGRHGRLRHREGLRARNRGPRVLAGLRAGARPGAQRRHASRATSAQKTTVRSRSCSPASTTPRSPPTPPRCPQAIRSIPMPARRCSAAACPCRGRSIAARWKFDAGDRPPAERDGYRPPVKLAVLLPLSGSLLAVRGARARRLPHRLLRRNAPSPRSRVLRHRRHAGRRSRRVSEGRRRRERLRRRSARPR